MITQQEISNDEEMGDQELSIDDETKPAGNIHITEFNDDELGGGAAANYDTRVQIPVDFSDEELLQYMKLAHERDMTFNELVEEALRHTIAKVNAGRLTKEDAQKWLEEQDEDKAGQ